MISASVSDPVDAVLVGGDGVGGGEGGAVSEFIIFIENFIQNYYGISPLSKGLQLKRTKIKVQGMRVIYIGTLKT